MHTQVPDKLHKIVAEIEEKGQASLTRLTVLKKWLGYPGRLKAFAIWMATQAVSWQGNPQHGATGKLFDETQALLAGVDVICPVLDGEAARGLYHRLWQFQNEYRRQPWGQVRIIKNWNLMLIEEALAIYLGIKDSPAQGYKLAADYCQHYDPSYGNGLNGPSRNKIEEMIQFIAAIATMEE